MIASRSQELQPQQLGAGVSGGAEAAVHATWRLAQNLPSDHVIVKLDFSNAFNCVRRDVILDAVAANMPEIYCLVHAAYSCEPILVYGEHQLRSSEGAQQGDPLGPPEFREAIHLYLLISSQQSRLVLLTISLLQEIFAQYCWCRHHYQPWCWHWSKTQHQQVWNHCGKHSSHPWFIHSFQVCESYQRWDDCWGHQSSKDQLRMLLII